jgi:hypothetical protein
MKIIDIAICKDNVDPLGFGRIRFSTYNELTGQKERAFSDYTPWDAKDRFVAKPFLPTNINTIPQVGQSCMIMVFDTTDDTNNQFYIPGPYTTSHDFTGQQFAQQVTHTTYGLHSSFGEKVFISEGKRKGEYMEPRAKGSLAKKGDYGIYGQYGSDVIFTENGINIRGGKLLSKEFANDGDRRKLVYQPLMAERSANLHLKKFPHVLQYDNQTIETLSGQTGQVKYFVEYSIDKFTGTTSTVSFFIYNTQNAGDDFKIENKNLSTLSTTGTTGCTLLNPSNITFKNNNDSTTPTLTYTGLSGNAEIYVTIRNAINQLHNYGLNTLDSYYSEGEMHPFYFRPTEECLTRTGLTETEITNRTTVFNNVNPFQIITNGLIFSKLFVAAPPISNKQTKKVLVKSDEDREQTFAALKSDRIFFMSTYTNEYQKIIDFKRLDSYEPTQENYIKDIEPNTYALVRGEVLVNVLRSMMDLFESHQHNLTDPLVKEDPNFIRLQSQITTLENDMLNNSIRIN